ncbi:CRISPR-associated endonuclease Cas2 [Candidatus Kaiserbacteria bacterium]|nr:CRISPR-associated endonuclease Cas2 [Candidatus Kaiserbacteria bacterium]
MGKIEESGRKRKRRKDVTSFVLGTVALTGMLGVAMVAPNVLSAMGKLGLVPGRRQKEIINRARDRLVRDGLLERDGFKLKLTSKGEAVLRRLEARDFASQAPKRWDGKWRVLIFDIPEYRKGLRDKVRRALRSIGFVRLQNSVWAYPYDCEDLIALLKADFKVGKDMLYMIVEELEGDWHLKKYFKIG